MTPMFGANLTDDEERFNRRHKKTRRLVESAFGLLKQRFGCLDFLRQEPSFSAKIINACVALHNYCLQEGAEPEIGGEDDYDVNEDENNIHLNEFGLESENGSEEDGPNEPAEVVLAATRRRQLITLIQTLN